MKQDGSLLFSISPLCRLAADVISDGKSIYFYLYDLNYEQECLGVRSTCWVKNLVTAPADFSAEIIGQPIMPFQYIDDLMDLAPWDESDLEIIWSKEGHIASLYYQGALYSVIPSWANGDQFPGYSRYIKENNKYAWSLTEAYDMLFLRMEKGKTFWKQEFNMGWQAYNTSYLDELKQVYGDIKTVYDLHKDAFSTRLLAVFEDDYYVYAFTIGCGIFCMPNVDTFYKDYEKHDRCEFAMKLSKEIYTKEQMMDVFTMLSEVCNIPWNAISFITHGHTLEMKVGDYEHCIIVDDDARKEPISLTIKKDDVHITWVVPVDQAMYASFQDQASKDDIMNKIIEEL